jgi:hypothetical protein
MALAQVKEDRDELRQERDDWRREAEMLCAEKLIAAKLRLTRGASLNRIPLTPLGDCAHSDLADVVPYAFEQGESHGPR